MDELPDYFEKVTTGECMDLGTMQRKAIAYAYKDLAAFEHDLHVMCTNAQTYNKPNTLIHKGPLGMVSVE